MPYMIQKDNDKYCVHKENADGSAGETIACHDTEDQAKEQMRALYASEADKSVMFYGDSVKMEKTGKISGYLVRFTDPKDADLDGEFFDKQTDLGVVDGGSLPIYYNHGVDGHFKNTRIGRGTVKYDDIGLWLDAQIEARDEYEEMIKELAKQGKLGWSSGAAGHLVDYERIGKSYHIKTWPIAEASLTPTPAEPRNVALPVKSLLAALSEDSEKNTEQPSQQEVQKEAPMPELEEFKAMFDEYTKRFDDKIAELKAAPVKAGFDVSVTEDEADKAARLNPFKTAGEFFKAVKTAGVSPSETDKRLLAMKVTGMSEGVPSDGGFLVPPQVAAGIKQNMWQTGSVLSKFNPIPVTGNSMTFNVVDESSRADGYRHGGILGYWLEEGGTKQDSKAKFRQLDLKLRKCAALCYATDELLDDASALESWLTTNVPDELRFQTEQAIINGSGVGKPLGILKSPALYTFARVDANEIDATDIGTMWAHRYAGVNDYVWFVSTTIFPQLINLTIGNQPMFWPAGGMGGLPYATILGRPVVETEYNPSLGIEGDILLASPSQYQMIEKGGVQSASSIHVKFTTDETAFRFVYRVDGAPLWNAKMSSAYASSDYISPFIALTASS